MTEYTPTKHDIDSFKRMLMHIPGNADIELIILKGHLLLEEQLRAIVTKRIRGHKLLELNNTHWQFYHIVRLAEALCHDEVEDILWKCIKKLNTIRNDMAHNLESKGLSDKIDDFNKSWPTEFENVEQKELLHLNLWSMHTILSGLVICPTADIVEL